MPELRQRALVSAWRLFAERGFAATSMAEVAQDCGAPLEALYARFGRKEDLVFALYRQLALQLEERLSELPEGKLSQRFARAMDFKVASLQPHRPALQGLFDTMLAAETDLGVFGQHMQLIRQRVRAVFYWVALGASDSPAPATLDATVNHLYRIHLALVFLWFRQPGLYPAARRLISGAMGLLEYGPVQKLLARVDELLPEPVSSIGPLPELILRRLFRHRRLQHKDECARNPCAQCLALHLPRVQHFVSQNLPIQMVLPAFPAKSPNLGKVLGTRPDTAERLALRQLQTVCEEIGELYPPGASITICSDGHVFSDLVGVPDETVTAYNSEIRQLIGEMNLGRLNFFNLQDLYAQPDYPRLRDQLLPHFSEPLEQIRKRVKECPPDRHLFDGLHRFLFEDYAATHPQASRNRARQLTKDLTYQVMARSNAWGRIVAMHFPEALRLSIHPQMSHSDKIGILLTPAEDNWVTPWHGVALLRDQDYLLTKREAAEKAGARLVFQDQRPTHFVQEVLKAQTVGG